MKRYMILFILILLLSACTDTSSKGSSNNNNRKWRSGSEGITMKYVDDSPPTELVSTQDLNVMVEYTNKGAYNLDKGNLKFYLSGYDPTIFTGIKGSEKVGDSLEGKNQFNDKGSQKEFEQWTSAIDLSGIPTVDSFSTDLTVTACYEYKTIATPSVCIDPQKYDQIISNRCQYSIKDLGSNQGAPIAVSKVEKKTSDDSVIFEIYIRNVGKGIPFSTKGIDNCHNSLSIKDINTVKLESIKVSNVEFSSSCQPSKDIRLNNGNGYIVCEMPLNNIENYFNGLMEIKLGYKYRETMSKSLEIVNLNRKRN
jgi:hypothetical protein